MDEIKQYLREGEQGEYYHSLTAMREDFTITELGQRGHVVFRKSHEDVWLEFYILQSHSASDTEELSEVLWAGKGTLGSLRELRHSFFPEYIFYVDLGLMAEAVKWLQTHFD